MMLHTIINMPPIPIALPPNQAIPQVMSLQDFTQNIFGNNTEEYSTDFWVEAIKTKQNCDYVSIQDDTIELKLSDLKESFNSITGLSGLIRALHMLEDIQKFQTLTISFNPHTFPKKEFVNFLIDNNITDINIQIKEVNKFNPEDIPLTEKRIHDLVLNRFPANLETWRRVLDDPLNTLISFERNQNVLTGRIVYPENQTGEFGNNLKILILAFNLKNCEKLELVNFDFDETKLIDPVWKALCTSEFTTITLENCNISQKNLTKLHASLPTQSKVSTIAKRELAPSGFLNSDALRTLPFIPIFEAMQQPKCLSNDNFSTIAQLGCKEEEEVEEVEEEEVEENDESEYNSRNSEDTIIARIKNLFSLFFS